MFTKIAAPSDSGSSSQIRARIGSELLVRVEFTVAVAYVVAWLAPLPSSDDSPFAASHFCMPTSALYAPSFTVASGRSAPMMQAIMFTWPMPREVASSTWLFCTSVAYAEVDGGSASAIEAWTRASASVTLASEWIFMDGS